MEREEAELIQRLQNTQLLQKAAYEDLESALTGGQVQFDGANTSQMSGQVGRPGTAGAGGYYKPNTASKPVSKMGSRK